MFQLSKYNAIAICIIVGVVLSACGSFRPPETCGVGGSADEAKYAKYFTLIELVNEADNLPGMLYEEGLPQFSSTDQLAVQIDSLAEVSVRVCVEERKGGGSITQDRTQIMPQGLDNLSLGAFPRGSYVVRVIVDDTLIMNLPFIVE